MTRSDAVAREFLETSGGDMTVAIHRMASTILAAHGR